MARELNGYHVALIFGGFFGTIIAVNTVLATQAVRTFPGLEVKNSYVASQSFDREREAQEALGWTTEAHLQEGRVVLRIDGDYGPAKLALLNARLGRKTYAGDDRELDFREMDGALVADVPDLAPGGWTLWLTAEAADGTLFRKRLSLQQAP